MRGIDTPSFSADMWVMHFPAHTSVGFATSERVPSGFGPMVGSPGRWAPPRFCTKDPPFLYSHIYNPNLPPDIHTALPASTPLPSFPSHLFFPLPLPGSWFALLGILLGFRQIGSCSEGGGCLASLPVGERDRSSWRAIKIAATGETCRAASSFGGLVLRQHEEAALRLLPLPAGRRSSSW